jgi:hypothetical protein
MTVRTRISSYRVDVGTIALYVSDCAACGIIFGITEEFEERRRKDGKPLYCPNGHDLVFNDGKTADQVALAKAEERARVAEQRRVWAESRESAQRREREAAERSLRTTKGHLTRLRNRIAAGVCPVGSCRRNFANVKAHIESQHPEWAHDHPDALKP